MPRNAILWVAGGIVFVGGPAAWWTLRSAPSTPSAEQSHPAATAPPAIPAPPRLDALDPQITRAIRQAMAGVSRAPDSVQAWRDLGVIYDANDMPGLAAECYAAVVARRDADVRGWYDLGVARGSQGDVTGALAAMARAIDLYADYPPAHIRRGLWRLELGDLDGAEESLARALEVDANATAAQLGRARVLLQRRAWNEALALLQPVAAGSGPNARHARQLLARAYRGLGRLDEAAQAATGGFGALVIEDPWRQEIDRARAGITASLREASRFLADGHTNEAVARAERIVAAHPDDAALLTAAAGVLREAGQASRAEVHLLEAIELRPGYYPAHLELARTIWHADRARQAEALSHVREALQLNSSLAAAHSLYGEILLPTTPRVAADAFAEAVRCDPTNPRYRLQSATASMRLEAWTEAVTDLRVLIQQMPAHARGHHLLGVALMQLGEDEQAAAALDRAGELDPANGDIASARRRLAARSPGL